MNRTAPLTRHTPLSRRSPLRRETPLPRVNRERQQRRREVGEVYGAYHAWIRSHHCVLSGHPQHRCAGPVEGAPLAEWIGRRIVAIEMGARKERAA